MLSFCLWVWTIHSFFKAASRLIFAGCAHAGLNVRGTHCTVSPGQFATPQVALILLGSAGRLFVNIHWGSTSVTPPANLGMTADAHARDGPVGHVLAGGPPALCPPFLRAGGLLLTCVVADQEMSYTDLNCMYCKQVSGCIWSLGQGLGSWRRAMCDAGLRGLPTFSFVVRRAAGP